MSVWNYLQISLDVFFLVGIVVMWIRLNRPAKEDPRLSRGLQLLQSKISILEDLSDRTDNQVKQMLKLLEKKGAHVQEQILHAKETIGLIEQSMNKSMEVAEIFEDKIPHEEIIERQSSKKYIEAARLAHEGLSAEEISKQVDLDVAEIEFIAKVNKDRLMFSEDDLPKWAQKSEEMDAMEMDVSALIPQEKAKRPETGFERSFEKAFENPGVSMSHLEELGKKFREACDEVDQEEERKAELGRKLKSGVNTAISSVLQPIEEVKSAIKSELEDLSNMSNQEDEFDWEEFVAQTEASQKVDETAKLESQLAQALTSEEKISTVQAATATMDVVNSPESISAPETSAPSTIKKETTTSIDKAMDRLNRLEERASQVETPKPVVKENIIEPESQFQMNNAVPPEEVPRSMSRFQIGIEENALKPEKIELETPSEQAPKRKMSFDIVEKVKQRAKEKIQSGEIRTKIKSSDKISNLQQLDFPEIKVTPNDHLG